MLKHDRLRLVEAITQDRREVTLLIAATPGANEAVSRGITNLGGKVQFRADDVSYLRAKLPTESVEKFSASSHVEAINLDGSPGYLNSSPDEQSPVTTQRDRVPPPNRETPPENPYLPSMSLGAPQFIAAHPTFDGRGVTVAVVDLSIDLLLPELQTAKTLAGQPTPKIIDVINAAPSAMDPSDEQSHLYSYLKIGMQDQVAANGGQFTYQNEIYTAPMREGNYWIGSFDERMDGPGRDLNRDGNPAGRSGWFAVLWDETTNTVWVDTNQNHSFADEQAMTDYRVRYDVGSFGQDDPATPMREMVGFTKGGVKPPNSFVGI